MTTFALSFAVLVGHRIGNRYQKPAEIVGGTILILISAQVVVVEHFGLLQLSDAHHDTGCKPARALAEAAVSSSGTLDGAWSRATPSSLLAPPRPIPARGSAEREALRLMRPAADHWWVLSAAGL